MFNTRSAKDKLDDLNFLLDTTDASLVLITESWFDGVVSDAMIAQNSKYYVLRKDRKHQIGGGVCALISKRFTVELVETNDDIEMLAFDILFDAFTYRCILCYRPPYYDNNAWNYLSSMLSCIYSLCGTYDGNVAIFGDFNLPYLSWDTLLVSGQYVKFHQALLDCASQIGLVQCVDEPTRGNNILDLILVNDPLLLSSCTVTAPFGNSDHETIEFNFVIPEINSNNKCDSKCVFNFKDADFDGLNAFLSAVDWQNVLRTPDAANDVNNCMDAFIDVLNEGINIFVPIKEVFNVPSSSNSRASVRIYPLFIRQLFRKKVTAWRLYKRFRNEQLKAKYKAAEKKFALAVNSFDAAKENEIINSGNVGTFYKYINNKLVTKSGVGALKDVNGVMVHEDAEKARVLNECYGNVFTVDNNVIPDFPNKQVQAELRDVDFNCDIVYKHLRNLKPKTSCGPDSLNAVFLKNLASSLSLPLSILFSSSFSCGDLPDIWKRAYVTPIFKKGQTCDPSNYRPISLTCVLCKIMEGIIK